MNCIEARALLAAYRDLDPLDAADLDEHLEQCASCRQTLAGYSQVGERMQRFPAIDVPADMHEKLMRSLATEHAKFIQRAVPGTPPPPDFLKPYMPAQPLGQSEPHPLASFSTAETGPLPVLPTPLRPRRRPGKLQHIGILALAATVLLAILTGSLTSLLLLAHNSPGKDTIGQVPVALQRPTNVLRVSYATMTSYPYVMSAVADNSSIYYTAYGSGTNSNWMLSRLDRLTQISTPLLSSASTNPLIVLGSQNGWLVWLQLETASPSIHQHDPRQSPYNTTQTWSLHYLSIADQTSATNTAEPQTIMGGTYSQQQSPTALANSPIQGIWFVKDTLLITSLNEDGSSHLWRYQLSRNNNHANRPQEIAQASLGHILTSPTANADGSQIYWADEWQDADGALHSDIWTRQEVNALAPTRGHWRQHSVLETRQFSFDGSSFHPLVIRDTLFLLNPNSNLDGTSPYATPTPIASPTTPTPVPTAVLNPTATGWADGNIYRAAPDAYVLGTLFMLPLNPELPTTYSQVNATGQVLAPQAGSSFVFWQNNSGGFGMYDVDSSEDVNVGSTVDNAQFVAINGSSAVWTVNTSATPTDPSTLPQSPLATIQAFNWPLPRTR